MNKQLEKWYTYDGKGASPDPKMVSALLQHRANGEVDDSQGDGFLMINWDTIAAYTLGEKVESKRGAK